VLRKKAQHPARLTAEYGRMCEERRAEPPLLTHTLRPHLGGEMPSKP